MVKKGYKQTEIGLIPEDWNVILFGQLISNLCYGPRFSSRDYSKDGNVKTIRGTDINQKGEIKYEQVPIAKLPTDLINYHKLISGDLVMITTADCGLTGVYVENGFPFIASAYAVRISLNSNACPFFFKHLFQTEFAKEQIDLFIRKGTVSNLPGSDISKFKFSLPPTLTEQEAIANALTDIDTLITNLENLIAKKKAIKQGAMQQLLTGKKRLQGFTREWEVKKIRDFSDVGRGRVISHNEINKSKAKKHPVYSSQTSNNGVMGYIDTFDFDGDYITWTTDGENAGTVFLRNGKFNCTNVCGTIKLKRNDFSFISYLLSTIAPNYVSRNLANPKLMNEPMKNIELTFPKDIKEQQAIAEILSDMDLEIEALETQKSKTQYLKQGMMQELLTGKTRLLSEAEVRLVKPVSKATKKENKIASIAAEPQPNYKTENARNEHFNDAGLIGTMAIEFGSEKYPLTRFMYTKVSYLFKRYKEEQDKGYLKKAAGPYKPKTRYGGAEKIALGSKYVKPHITNYKGKKHEHFLAGDEYQVAVDYFVKWYGANALQWIRQFKYTKRKQLEVLATVDLAIQDLKLENKASSLDNVKALIHNEKEWRPKLKREEFSDDNMEEAMKTLTKLFST